MYKLLFLMLLVSYSTAQGQSASVNNELNAHYKDGGMEGFQDYLRKNLITPDSRGLFKAKGKMYVSFSIDSTGNNSIEEIKNDIWSSCKEYFIENVSLLFISKLPYMELAILVPSSLK